MLEPSSELRAFVDDRKNAMQCAKRPRPIPNPPSSQIRMNAARGNQNNLDSSSAQLYLSFFAHILFVAKYVLVGFRKTLRAGGYQEAFYGHRR